MPPLREVLLKYRAMSSKTCLGRVVIQLLFKDRPGLWVGVWVNRLTPGVVDIVEPMVGIKPASGIFLYRGWDCCTSLALG